MVVSEDASEPRGINLHPVLTDWTIIGQQQPKQLFDPIFVEGFDPTFPHGTDKIGYTGTIETPSGAFSFNDKVYVFVGVQDHRPPLGNPGVRDREQGAIPYPKPGTYLISKDDPLRPGPFRQVDRFAAPFEPLGSVAPVKVVNAEHSWLPSTEHSEGVVMFAIGWNNHVQYSAINLSWMPLKRGVDPRPSDILYYTSNGWKSDRPYADLVPIFGKETNLIHLSAAFIEGLGRWIVIQQSSNPTSNIQGPIIGRIGTPPLDWSQPFDLFDPCRDGAYGSYMHWPGLDPIPFIEGQTSEIPGGAYGAFLLDRYTRWNQAARELDLYYLMSTAAPYQVQLMHSTLHLSI